MEPSERRNIIANMMHPSDKEALLKQTPQEPLLTIIAYNHNGYIISIVLAKSIELAYAYWSGQKLDVHTTQTVGVDIVMMEENLSGVVPLLKTRETFINPSIKPIVVIKL